MKCSHKSGPAHGRLLSVRLSSQALRWASDLLWFWGVKQHF